MEQTVSTDADTGTAARFRALLDGFRHRFDARLGTWLDGRRQRFAAEIPEAAEVAELVARLATSGGKRLRPALVWFTWRGCGGGGTAAPGPGGAPREAAPDVEDEVVFPLALASELLHTYLLVHDDIMDHADTRRGLPSAHAELARRHRERGWSGDPGDFGRTGAILVGDLAHDWAHELVSTAARRLGGERGDALAATFAATSQEVLAGQYLEVLLSQRGEGSEDDLARVLRLKSGRYTVERPMQLGALAAGAGVGLTTPLTAYGRAVGEAFQLQDDVLGTFGDVGETGKSAAGDLEEGKLTFLVFHALHNASTAEAEELRSALGSGPLDPQRVERLRGILESSGALERVRGMIGERVDTARAALDELSGRLTGEGQAFLAGLVDFVAERRR